MPPVKGQLQQRGKIRREQILDAAVEEFAKGYNGSVLANIAERVGLTQPAILHYFGSKENLLLAVLQERQRRNAESNPVEGEPGIIAPLRQHAKISKVIESQPGLTQMFAVLVAESLDAGALLHGYFQLHYRALRDMLAVGIAQDQARGNIRADIDPDLKAAEIVAFMDGAQQQWLLDPERISLPALYESYATGLLRDLCVERPASITQVTQA